MIDEVTALGSLGDIDVNVGDFNFGFEPSGGISNYANFDPSKYISDFMKSSQARMIKPSKRADSAKNSGSSDSNGEYSQTSGPGTYIGTGLTGIEVGDKDGIMEVVATAMRENPSITQEQLAQLVNSYQNNPSSFGQSPTAPTPFQPETGIFGGTLGPKLKNAIPAGLREFLGNVAKIHPATMNAVLMGKLVKGWQSADDKGKFMRNVMKGLAMSKFMGSKGLGLSSAQRSLAGEGMNVLRGEQSMTQGIGNFATDAGIKQLMRNVLPKAYEAQGMNGVYAAIAAIKMLGQRAKEGVSSLGGPGGGG